MPVLVDSDVLIEVTRARDAEIVERWIRLSESDQAILYSPVTEAELWAGARENEHSVLTNLFQAIRCVPISGEIGKRAGDYLRMYRKSHALELADALIGASAVVTGAVLWTRNRKHYPMRGVLDF